MEPATLGRRLTSYLTAVLLGLRSAVPPAGAQPTTDGAALALALRDNVVAIEATWEDGTVHDGFGFITGARDGETYIATAGHVLRGDSPGQIAETVELRLRQMPGRSYPGEVLETHEPGIDLAVLAAQLPSHLVWRRDALAPEPAGLTFGTRVWFIGRDRDWYVPANPGVVNRVRQLRYEIVVDDLGVRVGSSGAPLVAADGIVGMVVRDAAADTASATLITAIELAFREWGLPWELTPVGAPPEQTAPVTGSRETTPEFDGAPKVVDAGAAVAPHAPPIEINQRYKIWGEDTMQFELPPGETKVLKGMELYADWATYPSSSCAGPGFVPYTWQIRVPYPRGGDLEIRSVLMGGKTEQVGLGSMGGKVMGYCDEHTFKNNGVETILVEVRYASAADPTK